MADSVHAMTRVLLTGAAGFVGAALARRLLSRGYQVVAVISPSSSRRRLDGMPYGFRGIVVTELRDLQAHAREMRDFRPDTCIHLAWRGWVGPAADNLASLEASLALLRWLPDIGCRRFVSAGTCFEYDINGDDPIGEATPLRPRGTYAVCKQALYEVGQQVGRTTPMSVVHARIFNVYGPREHPRGLVPSVARAIVGGRPALTSPGAQRRDYLHVDDVASALCYIAESARAGAVNVGSGRAASVASIAEKIARILGRPDLLQLGALPYRPYEPPHVQADVAVLRGLGWTPRYDLESGLRETVRWWQAEEAAA